MTELRITITNESGPGGTFLTPFWFGFHNGSFDLFDGGQTASPGLEQIAEDGAAAGLAAELIAADADGQGGVVTGAAGPIATTETTSQFVTLTADDDAFLSLAAMLLPSNDAFIGTGEAVQVFSNGVFQRAQLIEFGGDEVYDAGTEFNTELDAAFINQTEPDTGLDENGVVRLHEGFNGSVGNPDGALGNPVGVPGEQLILGGVNAFGEAIDPVVADFTRPGAQIASVHVNRVTRQDGDAGANVIEGDGADDIVDAGAGDDRIFSGLGFDSIEGGAGDDFIIAGAGDDFAYGGADDDTIAGGAGRDTIIGGQGNDALNGAAGDDVLIGSSLEGAAGGMDERNIFFAGQGSDVIVDFNIRGDGESSFDVLRFAFDGDEFRLRSTADFLDFVTLIETDGDTATDALIVDGDADGSYDDLAFVFARDDVGDVVDAVTLLDIVGDDISQAQLVDAAAGVLDLVG